MVSAKLKPTPKSCIVILGMHRSGTSALAGVLSLLGVNLGARLLEAQEGVNPKGFWEHAAVVDLHDELLDELHSGWWDALPIPEGWSASTAAMRCREGLEQLIRQEFAGDRLWAVKDPRSCRLMPLWTDVMTQTAVHPNYVLMLRHPAEVADSLARRDGFFTPMTALLWLRNVLDSERDTRDQSRMVMTFDDLLSDWRTTLGRATDTFGIALPLQDAAIAPQVDAFLEPQLRHHSTKLVDITDPPMALAIEAYQAILVHDSERLDKIRARFEQEIARHTPWLRQTNELMLKLKAGKDAIRTSEDTAKASAAEAEAQRNEVKRIMSTPSWRITAPLRAIANFCRTLGK